MTGYTVLSTKDTNSLLSENLGPCSSGSLEDYGNPFEYYVHPNNDLVIITTPLFAGDFATLLPQLSERFANQKLLLGLMGQGATEQHIVTTYVSEDRKSIEIFDPKASDPQRFFSGQKGIGTVLRGLLRALNPFPRSTIALSSDNNSDSSVTKANYSSLGTQSFFDGVSCGYHNVANILACKKLIENGEEITVSNLLAQTKNPVSEAAKLLQEKNIASHKVETSFLDFMKKAWQDTVMPLVSEKQKETLQFKHYFLGWPQNPTRAQQIFYFASFSFIAIPLINLVRRPVEFILNASAETANYAKNRLINWAPTNIASQYLRSGLLLLTYGIQGLFKAAYLVIRTVTSPITSFEAAQTIRNPVLRTVMSGLSILMSVTGLTAIAIFLSPALLATLPGAAGVLGPVITTLSIPVVKLASLLSLTVSPVVAAMVTLVTGSSLYALLRTGAEKLLSKVDTVKSANYHVPQAEKNSSPFDMSKIPGSNAVKHLKAHEDDAFQEEDDNFIVLDNNQASKTEVQKEMPSEPAIPVGSNQASHFAIVPQNEKSKFDDDFTFLPTKTN